MDGMRIEWDVPVRLRDDVTVYVDIFRPGASFDEVFSKPLPIILTWSPYGKHGPKNLSMFPNSGVPEGSVSTYAVWEGPDPQYWTQRGYAIINGDVRGSWASEGNLEILGEQEALDGYDVIEWAAALPWSNGRVGLAGVSYLAVVQWRIAELNPPHLACINPWEGFSDLYSEYSYHGGIPETNFVKFMQWSCRCSLGSVEDWIEMHSIHDLRDDYFESKACQYLSNITVPAYVVASWGDQGLHTRGSIEAYARISSTNKWLEVHGSKKWQYFYQESSLLRQEDFYHRFLKNEPSNIDGWPYVRLEVRTSAFKGTFRDEDEWPISRTQFTKQYIDTTTGILAERPPQHISRASYKSTVVDDCLKYHYVFTTDTEITGSMRLRLWVSTDSGDDMDIFVQVDKMDKRGDPTPFVTMAMLDDGPLALGWLRVSHRELDITRTTSNRPWLQHKRRLMLRPQEVVPVDIEVWPSSTRFLKGESLRVSIQGNDIFRYDLPQAQLHQKSVNAGRHFIYSGPAYESYLVLPVVGPKGS